jgi:hypothetical protein
MAVSPRSFRIDQPELQVSLITRFIKGCAHFVRVIAGWCVYIVARKTPPFAYQSMIALFCLTGGRSNDALSKLIGMVKRPYRFPNATGVLGNMADQSVREPIVAQLRSRGYHVFNKCIPEDVCDKLLQYALSHPCTVRRMDGRDPGKVTKVPYSRGAPEAVRYDFDVQDLLGNQDVQRLLADLSFVALAQDYLGSRPVLDVLTMWWHTGYSDRPDSEAGQFFHFDLDRPKWLKFFIYLTDVGPDNGPHAFVAGSHRTGAMPARLLQKGYSRLSDEEVGAAFNSSDILELTAPRGSIIAEDTRGLHKGKHVHRGDRLVLQLQFSNSLFGGYYPKVELGRNVRAELKQALERYSSVYAAYL